MAFSARSAASWGELGIPAVPGAGGAAWWRASSAGRVVCVADLSWLDHSQTSLPLRMTSDSPDEPSRATRVRAGPAYQSRGVWAPEPGELSWDRRAPPADEPPPLEPEAEPPAPLMA